MPYNPYINNMASRPSFIPFKGPVTSHTKLWTSKVLNGYAITLARALRLTYGFLSWTGTKLKSIPQSMRRPGSQTPYKSVSTSQSSYMTSRLTPTQSRHDYREHTNKNSCRHSLNNPKHTVLLKDGQGDPRISLCKLYGPIFVYFALRLRRVQRLLSQSTNRYSMLQIFGTTKLARTSAPAGGAIPASVEHVKRRPSSYRARILRFFLFETKYVCIHPLFPWIESTLLFFFFCGKGGKRVMHLNALSAVYGTPTRLYSGPIRPLGNLPR